MADTPLAPLTKARPMTKEKAFVIAALRRHVAALDGIDEAALPTETGMAKAMLREAAATIEAFKAQVANLRAAPSVASTLSQAETWTTSDLARRVRNGSATADEAADAITALEADNKAKDARIAELEQEAAAQKARADDMHRRAQQAEAPKMAARDVANKMWNFVWKAGERFHNERARAKCAETELAALRGEVERVKSDRGYIIGFNHGWEEAVAQTLTFPAMLRKMWSGGEVQAWIDKAMSEARAALATAKEG